jgi:hypothetical protein
MAKDEYISLVCDTTKFLVDALMETIDSPLVREELRTIGVQADDCGELYAALKKFSYLLEQ